MATTFNTNSQGNVEVSQDGKLVSTGTADAAKAYGYQSGPATAVTPPAPAPAPVTTKGPVTPGTDIFGAPIADTGAGTARVNGGTYTGQDGNSYYKYDNTPVNAATQTENANGSTASTLGGSTLGGQSNPFISSSDSVQNAEKGITDSVSGLNGNNSSLTAASQNYLATLKAENDQLSQQMLAQDAGINSDYDQQAKDLATKQANETGVMNVTTQREGGYLGQGASQVGALQQLNLTHQSEMGDLESKRQSAISAANNAIQDKQFAIADSAAKEAKDIEATMYSRQQDYIKNQLSIQQAALSETSQAQTAADDDLTKLATFSGSDISKVPQATLDSIDKVYGTGFAQAYLQTTSSANDIKSSKDAIAYQTSVLDLLQKIPQGKTMTFPDPTDPSGPGTTYTGMGTLGDISTFNETDAGGNVTVIAYNKATNTVTKTPVGAVGKPDSTLLSAGMTATRLNYMDEYMNDPKNNIMISSDPSNPDAPKYMTASDYVAMYQKYVAQYPGHASEFTTQHPIEDTVLPSQVKAAENKFQNVGQGPSATDVKDGGSTTDAASILSKMGNDQQNTQ